MMVVSLIKCHRRIPYSLLMLLGSLVIRLCCHMTEIMWRQMNDLYLLPKVREEIKIIRLYMYHVDESNIIILC